MRLSTVLFLATVAVSGSFAIVAAARDDRAGTYLFKPLTTIIILLGAAFLVQPGVQPYRALVVLGLACALAGDVLLMLPRERFAAGLAAFFLSHVAYIAAFSAGNPLAARQVAGLLPFVAAAGAVTVYVWPGLGTMRVPVLAYAAAIAVMAWRAATRGQVPGVARASYLLALTGGCLFVACDAILAIRRFRHPSRPAHAVELGVYWTAQVLIALSIRM
jgi:uncharacterized membrane protein YhhN